MVSRTKIKRGGSPPALWPVVVQAFVGALIVSVAARDRWGTWDSTSKFIAVVLLGGLLLAPTVEIFRKISGRDVRFSNLAVSSYTMVWVATVLFTRGSR